ncbi:MAG: ATP-binding protein [Myxococcota bacterium]
MDDRAAKKPPRPGSLVPRVSAVKSIVTPRRKTGEPDTADVFQALNRARRDTEGSSSDQKVLGAYLGALESLYPSIRFAFRLTSAAGSRRPPVQVASHRIRSEAMDRVTITEAGLVRGGLWATAPALRNVTLTRTYRPILEATPRQAPHADGFDAPLTRGNEVIGAVCVEFDGREAPPAGLETTLLVFASHASASIENVALRREAGHLRDYLDKLLEHANIPVLVVDRDRSIRVVSQAFSKITGISADEVTSRDVLQLAPQTERVKLLSAFVTVLRGRTVPPFELALPRSDGGSSRLSFKLAPILDADGLAAGVLAIGQDRTEVRELEGQVIHADKLATLGKLAAGIVHEINNPLTSISVYGEYLLGKLSRSGAEPSDLKRVERILRSSDRIMSFTRNLLTYARPSKEEAIDVSVNGILDEAIDFCEHLAREANVTVVPDYANELPRLHAVPGQLHQVFVNLISNACNAMGDQGGVVSVQTRALGPSEVQIVFEDNGVGIDPADLDQVFEPFFSTRRKGKGTGLGLSIVKNIVEQHRGRIEIESTPGERTRVTVVLPAAPKNS